MNDEIKNLVVSSINIPTEDIEDINVSQGDGLTRIAVILKKTVTICPVCRSDKLLSKGFYTRRILIDDNMMTKSEVYLKCPRYLCSDCLRSFSESGHLAPDKRKVSYKLIFRVMELLKSPKITFREVSRITGISESTVVRIFDSHCHIARMSLPPVLCIDEVYTKNSDFKSKYSCIFYDFEKRSLIDVLPSRQLSYLHFYMKYIPKSERDNVRFISIDMYEPYRYIASIYFKKATVCVDSFHVVKHLNDGLNRIRIRYMKYYDSDSIEYYLLNRFKFLLFDGSVDLFNKGRYNSKLKRYVNYGQLLEMILSINDEIRTAYGLKEEYRSFNNNLKSREEALVYFDELFNDFKAANIYEYGEFVTILKNWKEEILNSFIRIDGKRINNGVAESINQDIATIIYVTKGIKNSDRRRKRIMYSINKSGFSLI